MYKIMKNCNALIQGQIIRFLVIYSSASLSWSDGYISVYQWQQSKFWHIKGTNNSMDRKIMLLLTVSSEKRRSSAGIEKTSQCSGGTIELYSVNSEKHWMQSGLHRTYPGNSPDLRLFLCKMLSYNRWSLRYLSVNIVMLEGRSSVISPHQNLFKLLKLDLIMPHNIF